MSSFDVREEAFETKFAHDEERAFKARARAGKRGQTGMAAEEYARALVDADVGATPDAALEKLVVDLAGYGVDAMQIREKRDALLAIVQRTSE